MSNTRNTTHENPISSVGHALNPKTGDGAHVGTARPEDHVRTGGQESTSGHTAGAYSHGTGTHTGQGHESLGSAANPNTTGGSHLPGQVGGPGGGNVHHQSHNPLSSSTHTGGQTGTGASVTGTHGAHTESTGHALDPRTGTGSHLPGQSGGPGGAHTTYTGTGTGTGTGVTGTHGTHTGTGTGVTGTHGAHTGTGAGLTGTHGAHTESTGHALDPRTGTGSHLPGQSGGPGGAHSSTTATHGTHDTTSVGHNTTGGATGGVAGATPSHSKPSIGDKIKGTVQETVGKVTHNPEKVAEGAAIKTGDHTVAHGTNSHRV